MLFDIQTPIFLRKTSLICQITSKALKTYFFFGKLVVSMIQRPFHYETLSFTFMLVAEEFV